MAPGFLSQLCFPFSYNPKTTKHSLLYTFRASIFLIFISNIYRDASFHISVLALSNKKDCRKNSALYVKNLPFLFPLFFCFLFAYNVKV